MDFNNEDGFRCIEDQLDCVFEINQEHVSGRSHWEVVIEEIKSLKPIESPNELDYSLTKLEFEVIDQQASRYNTSMEPHYYLNIDGVPGDHISPICSEEDERERFLQPILCTNCWTNWM